jgi:DNA repair protein RecN (Recombination protein N)
LQDLALELRNYAEGIEFNPRLLDQVEERIDLINNLKRKYGDTIETILNFAEQARKDLDSITHAEERLSELEEKEGSLLHELWNTGKPSASGVWQQPVSSAAR